MTFLEALQVDDNTEAVGKLTTRLRDDELPSDVQKPARAIASQMELINDGLDDFRSAAALVPTYAQDRMYSVEGARELQTEANLRVIREHDPEGRIDALETNIRTLLSKLAQNSAPVPPTDDPALLQSLLLGARQDAGLALAGTRSNFAEAILNLQTEALENDETGLAYLLGATEWPVRFVRANGSPEEQIDLETIRGTLRDNVSDPAATPYRQAAERLSDLDDVPEGYRVTWKFALEESGLLTEEVAAALGLS